MSEYRTEQPHTMSSISRSNPLKEAFREATNGEKKHLYAIIGIFGVLLGFVISYLISGDKLAKIAEQANASTAVFLGSEPGKIAMADTTGGKLQEVRPCLEEGSTISLFPKLKDNCRIGVVPSDKEDAEGEKIFVLVDRDKNNEVIGPDRILISETYRRWSIKGSHREKWCRWDQGSCSASYEH
jgi:hypothetical protein